MTQIIPNTIKSRHGVIWSRWVRDNIGTEGKDWRWLKIHTHMYDDKGESLSYYSKGYFVIPDEAKAVLWLLRWA